MHNSDSETHRPSEIINTLAYDAYLTDTKVTKSTKNGKKDKSKVKSDMHLPKLNSDSFDDPNSKCTVGV